MEEGKITAEQFDEQVKKLIVGYLTAHSPEHRHQLVMSWNFDNDAGALDWIIDQEDTDQATALAIYWMMAPRWSKKFEDRAEVEEQCGWYLCCFDFIEALEEKYMKGFFKNQNIAYDPAHDWNGEDWTADYAYEEVVREIPEVMFQALQGTLVEPPTTWNEGLPDEIHDEVDRLISLLEDDDEEDDEE